MMGNRQFKGQPIRFRAIGHVGNKFDEPVAPDLIRATESQIVLEPAFAEGLSGLETGQRVMVVFYFHRSEGYDLRQHPRGETSAARRLRTAQSTTAESYWRDHR